MIHLTRLNHDPLVLNSDLIVHVEVTPDTVITLTTGETLMVLESAEEVVERVIAYRRSIFSGIVRCPVQVRSEGSADSEESPVGCLKTHG